MVCDIEMESFLTDYRDLYHKYHLLMPFLSVWLSDF